MLHSILEVLPNFVGHSVAERSAIEFARRSPSASLRRTALSSRHRPRRAGSPTSRTGWPHSTTSAPTVAPAELRSVLAAAPTGKVQQIGDERAPRRAAYAHGSGAAASGSCRRRASKSNAVGTLRRSCSAAGGGHRGAGSARPGLRARSWCTRAESLCVAIRPERKGVPAKSWPPIAANAQAKRVKADSHALRKAAQINPDEDGGRPAAQEGAGRRQGCSAAAGT